jgi:hypothetical protein
MNYLYAVTQCCGILVIFSQVAYVHLSFLPTLFAQTVLTSDTLSLIRQVEDWGIGAFLVAGIVYLIRDRKMLTDKLDEMTAKIGGLTEAMHANTEVYKLAAEKLMSSNERQIESLSELKINQMNLYSRLLEKKEH